MLYPHQFIMSVAAAEKDIMACGFPPPSLPASTNWFVNDKMTVFALAVMEYAVGVSKFGKNPKTLLVHQY